MNKTEMLIIDIPYRELHLLMDNETVEKFESCGNTIYKTYIDTENAVYSQTPLIFTTITHFLKWSFATRLFVHINGEEHELTIGDCGGYQRIINGYQYLFLEDNRIFRRKILKINNAIAFSEWEPVYKE